MLALIHFSGAMAFRKEHLEAFQKKYGIKIGFMSIFTKASAYALQDQPVVNAVIDGAVSITFFQINTPHQTADLLG